MQHSPDHPPPLTPKEQEAQKDKQQRVEDIAYTLNHAISCGVTDIFIQPGASAWIDTKIQEDKIPNWLRWVKHLFEDHSHHHHGKGEHCADATHHHVHKPSLWENTKHWVMGEIIGDVGAVPLTIWMQRSFPGFMQTMRRTLEPLAGGAFHNGAKRDAKKWAIDQGYAPDSPEAKAKEAQLYEHEMSHLPQAVVWNAFSIPINLGSQWLFAPAHNKPHPFNLIVGKTFGAVISNTALLGGRAVAPEAFNEWDRWSSRTILQPTMNMTGRILGLDQKTTDEVMSKEHEHRDWQKRVREEKEKAAAPEAPSERQANR